MRLFRICWVAHIVFLIASPRIAREIAFHTLAVNTRFLAVAEQAIAAVGIVGDVIARIGPDVARVVRATCAVVAGRRRAGPAIQRGMACFRTVAEYAVVAVGVDGDVVARVGTCVARVVRASDTVIAIRCGADLARTADTGFRTSAEQTIIAIVVAGTFVASVGAFGAVLARTRIAAGLTIQRGIARFATVAEQGVIAVVVVSDVVARVRTCVARVVRASDTVIAIRYGAGLAQTSDTGFRAVTE